MRLVDSHCHLDDEQFDPDREAAIERAHAVGVDTLLAVGTGKGPPDLEAAIRLADAHARIYATVGVHPHDASKADASTFDHLRDLLSHPKVLALGEIGLDYHYDFSPRNVQQEVFSKQLALAQKSGKPVIIHTREAWDDTLRLLKEAAPHACLMHCFSGGLEQAEQVLEMGFFVSFAGVVTFPKALGVQAAARAVPPDRLLIETDSPYLAPVPRRGKRNEPAFVVETAKKLAELRSATVEEIAAQTTKNFEAFFGL